jgi:hypothetical protein
VRDAFFQVSISAQNECVVVEQLWPELGAKGMFGESETNCIRKALSEGTGCDLDTWGVATLRMTGCRRTKLPKVLDVIQRETKTGQVQHRILEDRSMTAGKDEPVSVWPIGATGVVSHDARIKRISQRRECHGRSGMTGVRLLRGIHGKATDNINGSGFDSTVGHGRTLVVATSEDDC